MGKYTVTAYDQSPAQQIPAMVSHHPGFNEKEMFGGNCFLLHGIMLLKDDRIVSDGSQNNAKSPGNTHARQVDITWKPMKGWVMVSGKGLQSDNDLMEWVRRGVTFALSLPSKYREQL